MKKIICLLLICISTTIFASVPKDVNSLIKRYRLSNASIGIAVNRVKTGKLLYSHKKDRSFIPASNNKVFTAVAALTVLPKNFSFTTTALYNRSQFKKGTLKGNLYLEFTGDPSLTGSALHSFISKIKQKGIRKVTGDIVLVANHFTGNYIPKGWSNSDTPYCFSAPTSTMNMNRNCFVIKLIRAPHNKTVVHRVSNAKNIKIHNATRLVKNPVRSRCKFHLKMTNQNILRMSGCLKNRSEYYMSLAVANPALKTKDTIKDFLRQIGIRYSGKITFGLIPKKTKLTQVTQLKSDRLSNLIMHMLLHSDNLYAETFARTVGYTVNGKGNIADSAQTIRSLISKTYNVRIKKLRMADGSGLSHLDSMSPAFMVGLLDNVYKSRIGKKLLNALPTSGVDGTIAYRMGGELLGRVHAKTGTLTGVSTLSGYVLTKKDHLLAFSILLNKLTRSQRKKARIFQNLVVRSLYNNF